jgi:Lipocalin-like domain
MNNRTTLSAYSTLLLFAAVALSAGSAAAQDAKSLAGTYASVTNAPYGDNPRGQLILERDGHYSIILTRATLAKIAAGERDKGTAEENKAIVEGSIAHFGKYTVDTKDKTITFNVEGSTFPNWDGSTFKRAFKVSGDQLTYTNNAPSGGGGAIEVVWKRVK